jgi:uncharacterized membrane protein YjfL (UPF0719 family)
MDWVTILVGYLKTIGWGLIAAFTMSLSMGILLKIYDMMTPINEWKEIEKGNIACAIVMASVILAYGLVVGLSMVGPESMNAILPK